ncbi:MAG: helix-turn-helix domain-containing protein [Alphaproteobacteria bacterium]|nr:helix-turn-helix domain-containing protein [Alphaproteobacteria bacterium]
MALYHEWLTEENLIRLTGWARTITETEIAANIGITRQTLIEWKKKHPKIRNALREGREVTDIKVENALLKAALGYETTEYMIDANGKKRAVKKQVPPNTTAMIFWLKNRKAHEWRDKREYTVEGDIKTNNPYAELTTEELRKLAEGDDN